MTPDPRVYNLAAGALVADLRRRHGWSQAELGRRAGISQGVVSRVEAGRVPATAYQFTRLSDAFGIAVAELHERTDALLRRADAAATAVGVTCAVVERDALHGLIVFLLALE